MDTIQAVLFDLDGTVYVGEQLISGADNVINDVLNQQKQVAFLTNNSTKTREDIQHKLKKLGIETELSSIYTSASVTANYLVQNHIKSVYCLGTDALKLELAAQGIAAVSDASVDCVVIGMTYDITEKDFAIIREISSKPDSIIVACNLDLSYPDGSQSTATGCGHVVQQIEDFIQRKVDLVVGKPSRYMLDEFIKQTSINYENIMVVGDSYTSDIELALQHGCIPVLIGEEVLQHDNCITINNIQLVPELFTLPSVLQKLGEFQNEGQLIEDILNPYHNLLQDLQQVYIFGAQKLGEKIFDQCCAANIEVLGFIDNDVRKQGGTCKGKRIFALEACRKNEKIIIASTTYLGEIQKQLLEQGYLNSIPFTVLSLFSPAVFVNEPVFVDMHKDIVINKYKYISLYLRLGDSLSKETLCRLLTCRLNFKFHELGYSSENHYFEDDLVLLNDKEVFIDGGGYSGDTTKAFIKKVSGQYNEIHIFEPDEQLMNIAKLDLKGFPNIVFHQKGLFSHETQLSFNQTGGLDGAISSEGRHTIDVTAIDLAIPKKISFIKLDIEGAEEQALRGAAGQLSMYRPKLAIACYHKAGDLWNLPRVVLEISPNYNLYFRHYSQSALETVLYCIPKDTA
ncbi:HAD-IIA family hydrolase [Paenibacillus silvae]|uniref:HAD-IIA family hydrolase n=1 Tax=Paenibacillus silvae TaxID=1325358 RepID=UPI0025A2A31B|nr:HAD-IIA family hydrolase [Paenibacillus silvae]MDM5281344.1 HAD-IIA family hydrolase [Paenibacillus silvae]